MKKISIISAVIIAIFMITGCKTAKTEMSIEDFAKIDMEITGTDMTPASRETVAKKYGYSLEQYEQFEQKVTADPKLQEKLGELRLKDMEKTKQ
jgi:hypothetical protein